jgi:sugar lactone lactonase YvrE
LSYSDGLAIDDQGVMYYGLLDGAAIAKWHTNQPISTQEIIVARDSRLYWPDTFAFDGDKNLLATTNKLHLYFTNTMVSFCHVNY